MVAEALGHGPVDLLLVSVEPHVVGVHVHDVRPARTGGRQGPLNVAEGLGNLVPNRLWRLPVVVPRFPDQVSRATAAARKCGRDQ